MDRRSFNKQSRPDFKRKGNRRTGTRSSSRRDQVDDSSSSDTVYRILCEHKRIGTVIGKGGNIIRALREETRAKIVATDPVPTSDDRVIIIYSSPKKIVKKDDNSESPFEIHCAAQDALLKVHEKLIEEDVGDKGESDKSKEIMVSARLLVPHTTVGCLLGRKGDVIQRLRSETGATIRVLSSEHLPPCARSTDELVQISGNPAVVKRALYEVSTRLHQSPKKEQPPSVPPPRHGRHDYYPPGPPVPQPYYDEPSPWIGGGVRGGPPIGREQAPIEFSMKILCTAEQIGGVIGKGGCNVRQLEQATGADIHVEVVSSESQERVIRVSSFELPWDPISQTIEAILQLQDKTSEVSEKGVLTTRILVPSSKVGCLLGQGGQIINGMRRRTLADIRVLTKEDKPKWAINDLELVQISGHFRVARDALAEIASRLRERVFQNAEGGGAKPAPVPPIRRHVDGPSMPGPMRSRGYSDYEGGGSEYERRSYPVHSSDAGYGNINSGMEQRIPNHVVDSAAGGINSNEMHLGAPQTTHYDYTAPQDYHQNAYPNTSIPQNTYAHDINAPQIPYQNVNPQQGPYPNHVANDPYNASYQGSYQY